jgi:RNA polymerase sigma-70 factor (ECF subfamily)
MEKVLRDAIERSLAGDSSAFEPIVRQYERPLRAWLAGHAQPGIDVDEIAQRSFIAAYSNLSQFQLGTSFSAWLFAIAKYQLRTETTRLRRLADYHSRYAPVFIQETLEEENPESMDVWERRLEHLQECIKQLGGSLTQYLTWRYRDQISIDEMATVTGRSTSAVKKQLWSLRQKLLKCIEYRSALAEGEMS